MAQSARDDGAAEQPVALEAEQQLGQPVGRLGTDQAAADAQGGEIGLVAGALGELGGATDQGLGISCEADDGLWIQIDDGTPLLLRVSASD